MIFNIHEFNDGYTNKLGVKQKEVLRKGSIITETIHETIDGTNKMEDKNFQEKGPLGPPSPPPNVIPRIPSPSSRGTTSHSKVSAAVCFCNCSVLSY